MNPHPLQITASPEMPYGYKESHNKNIDMETNTNTDLIFIYGKNKTESIEDICEDYLYRYVKYTGNSKTYSYSHNNVIWIRHVSTIAIESCRVYIDGIPKSNVVCLKAGADGENHYYVATFKIRKHSYYNKSN